jgi:hypothetical protein
MKYGAGVGLLRVLFRFRASCVDVAFFVQRALLTKPNFTINVLPLFIFVIRASPSIPPGQQQKIKSKQGFKFRGRWRYWGYDTREYVYICVCVCVVCVYVQAYSALL